MGNPLRSQGVDKWIQQLAHRDGALSVGSPKPVNVSVTYHQTFRSVRTADFQAWDSTDAHGAGYEMTPEQIAAMQNLTNAWGMHRLDRYRHEIVWSYVEGSLFAECAKKNCTFALWRDC